MPEYEPAPELEEMARPIIERHHPRLVESGVLVEFVWQDKASKGGGKVTLAYARKISGLSAFLARGFPFYVIVVAEDRWRKLSQRGRRALLDHELCHLDPVFHKGEWKLDLRHHDVEEFGEIVRRHGLWKEDLDDFAGDMQDALPFEADVDDDGVVVRMERAR